MVIFVFNVGQSDKTKSSRKILNYPYWCCLWGHTAVWCESGHVVLKFFQFSLIWSLKRISGFVVDCNIATLQGNSLSFGKLTGKKNTKNFADSPFQW